MGAVPSTESIFSAQPRHSATSDDSSLEKSDSEEGFLQSFLDEVLDRSHEVRVIEKPRNTYFSADPDDPLYSVFAEEEVEWLEELPLEIIKNIVTFLDLRSGLRLSQTCRIYYENEVFYKGLNSITLAPFWNFIGQEEFATMISTKPLERLRHFDMSFCNRVTRNTLASLSRLTSLRSLSICHSLQFHQSEWNTLKDSVAHRITSIDAFDTFVDLAVISHFPQLERLILGKRQFKGKLAMLNELPLKVLHIPVNPQLGVLNLSNLVELKLYGDGRIASSPYPGAVKFDLSFLSSLTLLEKLDIQVSLDNDTARSIIGEMPRLRSLHFSSFDSRLTNNSGDAMVALLNFPDTIPPYQLAANIKPPAPQRSLLPLFSQFHHLTSIELLSPWFLFDEEDLSALSCISSLEHFAAAIATPNDLIGFVKPHFHSLSSLYLHCGHFERLPEDSFAHLVPTFLFSANEVLIPLYSYFVALTELRKFSFIGYLPPEVSTTGSGSPRIDGQHLCMLTSLQYLDLCVTTTTNLSNLSKLTNLETLLLPEIVCTPKLSASIRSLPKLCALGVRLPGKGNAFRKLKAQFKYLQAVHTSPTGRWEWWDKTEERWRVWPHQFYCPSHRFRMNSKADLRLCYLDGRHYNTPPVFPNI
eukprot:TRINITY_DN2338_c0_g1_i1.p1 TRINITY_DN2338_c0_g1~~TRINITY_DN2338_c0_g1_i1.p1  ORF type:complete len:684 (+),score=74.63 TRINITY_DN2338_c0_g1_i1:128-2053(+)